MRLPSGLLVAQAFTRKGKVTMGMDYGCAAARVDLAVYVLGAIDSDDRAKVNEHLRTCLRCRRELASLAAIPALLRRVPNAQAILSE
jgi:predicted anti-sigma-YlaC factor YlaD